MLTARRRTAAALGGALLLASCGGSDSGGGGGGGRALRLWHHEGPDSAMGVARNSCSRSSRRPSAPTSSPRCSGGFRARSSRTPGSTARANGRYAHRAVARRERSDGRVVTQHRDEPAPRAVLRDGHRRRARAFRQGPGPHDVQWTGHLRQSQLPFPEAETGGGVLGGLRRLLPRLEARVLGPLGEEVGERCLQVPKDCWSGTDDTSDRNESSPVFFQAVNIAEAAL